MRTAVHRDDAKSVLLLRQDRDVLGILKNVVSPRLVHKARHARQEAVRVLVDVLGFVLSFLNCRPGLQRKLSVRWVDDHAFSRPSITFSGGSNPRAVVPGRFEVFFRLRPVTPVAAEVRSAVQGARGIECRLLVLGTSPEQSRIVEWTTVFRLGGLVVKRGAGAGVRGLGRLVGGRCSW